jgi:uncharacterized membrane protein
MKSTQTTLIKRISNSCFLKLFLLDLILVIFFRYYQPLCEPCIDEADCPPCLSKQQYFIMYSGLAMNLIIGIYCLYKNRRSKNKNI